MVRRFLAEIICALDFLHSEKGVVYRDLKLENVLVVDPPKACGPHVKLGDFGASREVGWGNELQNVTLVGTPYFAAPEVHKQMLTRSPLLLDVNKHKSLDIFSYGVTAFVLAHGFPYHKSYPVCVTQLSSQPKSTNRELCDCGRCALVQNLKRFPTDVGNTSLIELIQKCVVVNPQERPSARTIKTLTLFAGAMFNDEDVGRMSMLEPSIDFKTLETMDI